MRIVASWAKFLKKNISWVLDTWICENQRNCWKTLYLDWLKKNVKGSVSIISRKKSMQRWQCLILICTIKFVIYKTKNTFTWIVPLKHPLYSPPSLSSVTPPRSVPSFPREQTESSTGLTNSSLPRSSGKGLTNSALNMETKTYFLKRA